MRVLRGDDDYIVSFDVVLKPGMGQEREGVLAAHHACDEFIQIFREQMKKFRGDLCTERHEYHDVVRPGKKRVLIVKQVAGQGWTGCTILRYLQKSLRELKTVARSLIWEICR